jgi:membrane protease YdiL (CAAX protease family)
VSVARGTPGFWLALAAFVVVWSVRATIGFRIDQTLHPDTRPIYSSVVKLALWAVPAAAFAIWIRRDAPLQTLRLGMPATRTLPFAAVLMVVYLAGVAFDVARKHGRTLAQLGEALAARGAATFAWGVPSAFAEELVFRGLVQTELTERWGFWRANAVGSLVFVAMHWPHRIWRNGFGLDVVGDAPALLLIALTLGFLTQRTGSIWPAVVFHAANNTISGIL